MSAFLLLLSQINSINLSQSQYRHIKKLPECYLVLIQTLSLKINDKKKFYSFTL